jgi:hypothetical protein
MGMQDTVWVEAISLVERMSPDDMPAVTAAILDAWCAKTEASHDSVAVFVGRMIAAQESDQTRHVLMDMVAKYEGALSQGH